MSSLFRTGIRSISLPLLSGEIWEFRSKCSAASRAQILLLQARLTCFTKGRRSEFGEVHDGKPDEQLHKKKLIAGNSRIDVASAADCPQNSQNSLDVDTYNQSSST